MKRKTSPGVFKRVVKTLVGIGAHPPILGEQKTVKKNKKANKNYNLHRLFRLTDHTAEINVGDYLKEQWGNGEPYDQELPGLGEGGSTIHSLHGYGNFSSENGIIALDENKTFVFGKVKRTTVDHNFGWEKTKELRELLARARKVKGTLK